MAVSKNSSSKSNKSNSSKAIEKETKAEVSTKEEKKVEKEENEHKHNSEHSSDIPISDSEHSVSTHVVGQDEGKGGKKSTEVGDKKSEVSDEKPMNDEIIKEDTVTKKNKPFHKLNKYFTYLWNGMSSEY